MADDMATFFKQQAGNIAEEITAWRRHLHANPERSFAETATTAYIVERLKSFGYTNVKTGFGPVATGVQAEVGSGGRCVLLRADIDALPVPETADVPWRSKIEGVSHACGHDAHTAVLLGVAKMLKECEARLPGRVKLLFQPGEEEQKVYSEGPEYGSYYVVQSGILDGVDAAFACHVWGVLPAGVVFVKDGPTMMASARFGITVTGQGTHGASPHLGRDPIVACCDLVSSAQTIVSRELSPLESGVLSVGTFQAGTVANVIPQEAAITGTIRTAGDDTLAYIVKRLPEVAVKVAEAHRCTAKCEIFKGCNAVVNDPAMADIVREVATRVRGAENVRGLDLMTASEDFSAFAAEVPSALYFIGLADSSKGIGQSQHDPAFQINDDVLADNAAVLAGCAWRFLAGK